MTLVEFPSVADGDDIVVSATTFVAFRKCPEQGSSRFRGIYSPDTPAAFKGNLAHRVFARHLRSGPIPDAEFEDVCRREIGEGLNHKLASLKLKPSGLRDLIAEVSDLYQRFKAVSIEGFVDGEVDVTVEPAPGVTLRGQIDAVFAETEGGLRLVDWKTGRVEGSEDQLAFYVLLWVLHRDELPGRIEAVSVSSGETAAWVPTAPEVRETARQVADLVDVMRRSWVSGATLERIGGPWCRFCPLLDDCPEGRSATSLLG